MDCVESTEIKQNTAEHTFVRDSSESPAEWRKHMFSL